MTISLIKETTFIYQNLCLLHKLKGKKNNVNTHNKRKLALLFIIILVAKGCRKANK